MTTATVPAHVAREPWRFSVEDYQRMIEIGVLVVIRPRSMPEPDYARAGIAEMWLVDLTRDVVIVATEPSPEGYGTLTEHRPGDVIAPRAFPDATIDLTALLRR